MIKDKILLPLIEEVIDKLKDVKYLNKLDFIWEYNNIQIKKGDKWKAVFPTNEIDILWTMQLAMNISIDNEQHIQEAFT